jgi:type II secretory pathway pseudopilin PulG
MKQLQKKNEAGFSFIELMIVSVILIIVIGLIGTMMTNLQGAYTQQKPRTDSINDATAALDMMTRLIKMAGNNPNGTTGIQGINPGTTTGGTYQTIRIQSDWHGTTLSSLPDGNIDDSYENVRFSVQSNSLMKEEPTDIAPVSIMDNVTYLQFIYYNKSNVMITDPVTNNSSIARVDITLIAQPPGTTAMTFTSSAYLRGK